MEALPLLLMIFCVAVGIAAFILSRKAKRDSYFNVRIPAGQDVQDLIDSVMRDLPPGWVPVGAKKGHFIALRDWTQEGDGGNLLDIATGSGMPLGSLYVVSVEMGVTTQDAYGRPVEVPFDQVPPQSEYEGHAWVSFASRGQGRFWGFLTSLKVIKAKKYLEERLSSQA